jgi:hypothetical protein
VRVLSDFIDTTEPSHVDAARWGKLLRSGAQKPVATPCEGATPPCRRRVSAPSRRDAAALALTEELGAQLGRMKGAGAKLVQLLSMLAFQREALPGRPRRPARWRGADRSIVRRVVEHELDAPIRELFADFDEEPLALASLGQVHRARAEGGAQVAVKVQHPGVAESIEGDLRNLGLVRPILSRIAPGVDARALLAEVRDLISDELDYELEAQHQRRLERRFRGHPHILVARVHTGPLDAPGARQRSRGRAGSHQIARRPRPSAAASASWPSASTSGSPGATESSRGTPRRQLPAVRGRSSVPLGLRPAARRRPRPHGGRARRHAGRSPTATLGASTTGSRA